MAHCMYTSPIGELTLVASKTGLQAVWWPDDTRALPLDEHDDDHPVLMQARQELDEYFAGQRQVFEVPLAPAGTDFQRRVWEVLRAIPYAQTITYAEQARRLGDARKARAVGAANGRNPLSIIVPCHRVVGSSGALTGFAGGLDTKQWLLEFERAKAGRSPDREQ